RRGSHPVGVGGLPGAPPGGARGLPQVHHPRRSRRGARLPPADPRGQAEDPGRELLPAPRARPRGAQARRPAGPPEPRQGPPPPALERRALGMTEAALQATPDEIYGALRRVYDTCSLFNRTNLNIVEMGLVRGVSLEGAVARVSLLLSDPMCVYF